MDSSDEPNKCSYCNSIIDSDDFLNCKECQTSVHIKCLKRPGTPGDLLGDVFFTFTCSNCAADHKEIFVRQKLPWLMIITLTIYNLSIQSKGLSHQGYFHWRTHIANFIDKNWNFLFDPTTKRKKKWIGTISGALSHNSPALFTSGQEYFQDSGWWKLTYNQTPKFYWKLYEQLSLKKQQLRNERRCPEESTSSTAATTSFANILPDDVKRIKKEADVDEPFSRTIPYMGRKPKELKRRYDSPTTSQSDDNRPMNSVQSGLMDFLAENLSSDELLTDLPPISTKDLLLSTMSPTENFAATTIPDFWNADSNSLDFEGNFEGQHAETEPPQQEHFQNLDLDDSIDSDDFKPRIIEVTNYQEAKDVTRQGSDSIADNVKLEPQSESESDSEEFEYTCEKSLFTIRPKREYPWKDERENDFPMVAASGRNVQDDDKNVHLMTEYDERELYRKLQAIMNVEKEFNFVVPCKIRRLFRKLSVRNTQRNNFKPIFNLDTFGRAKGTRNDQPQILDRYHQMIIGSTNRDTTFQSRIIGSTCDEIFESPFTSRLLHPFIYRDTKCFPLWVKLMCELQHAVTGEVPSRSSIDFCYVRPYHIAAVNGLLQQMFWPGIDMSDSLSYPDFSVVALYKKLVVGCAFLVPDVSYNEAYISFMAVRSGWERCGIASFMLYHLTQTCMGKDITLHVSATNPAICLYQKFGFKIEEVILDFYEKYLPADSTHSRHAFLLRMTR